MRLTIEAAVQASLIVAPAQAGAQKHSQALDSRLRGNDTRFFLKKSAFF
jgi:hypothetical protein